MSQKKKEALLPVGGTIDHSGRELRIMRRLNAGLTGEVYEGELAEDDGAPLRVAVKVMRALEFPMARQLFEQESETLSHLMHLEDQANREARLSLKVAPAYHGRGEHDGAPYLVMEFIAGREIPELLREQGCLPEAQALTAGWHLYRTLDVMHARLKKTYIDLKFENLWWVGGEADGQLKLTDFGTLEEIKPDDTRRRGVRRDLLLAGVYLFAMLTGETLEYSLGELKRPDEPEVLTSPTAPMSWGTRQLLRRLLHRDPAARPADAAAVARELRTLVEFWGKTPQDLIGTAEGNLDRAEGEADPQGPTARDYAARARSALDIAGRLAPAGDEDLDVRLQAAVQRADRALSLSDYLTRGRALFKGRSYALARDTFEQGARWGETPALFRRWAYLARAGEEISPTVFDGQREAAIQALDRLNEGRWAAAAERLGRLAEGIDPDGTSSGLTALRTDCALFAQLAAADEARAGGAFTLAAQAYRAAMDLLARLPDADSVRREGIGDLLSLAEEMEWLAQTRGLAAQGMDEARRAGSEGRFDEAVKKTEEVFRLDRDNPERLDDLEALAGDALERLQFDAAVQAAEIGISAPRPRPSLLQTLTLATLLRGAGGALKRQDLDDALDILSRVWLEFARHPRARPAVEHLLGRAAEQAKEAEHTALLMGLADFYERLPGGAQTAEGLRETARRIGAAREARLGQTVDQWLAAANQLLNFDLASPAVPVPPRLPMVDLLARLQEQQNRLENAERLVGDAARIAPRDPARTKEIASLKGRIESALKAQRERTRSHTRATEAARARRDALVEEWERGKSLREWASRGAPAGAGAPALEVIASQIGPEARGFLLRCYGFLAEVDAADPEVKRLVEEAAAALDGLGVKEWEALQRQAADHLDRIRGEFNELEPALERGEIGRVAEALDRLANDYGASPEWAALSGRVALVREWRAWQERNAAVLNAGAPDPAVLEAIRGFMGLKLPATCRQDPPVRDYLPRALDTARTATDGALQDFERPEFVARLKTWLNVAWTARLAAGESASAAWDADGFLHEAHAAVAGGRGMPALGDLIASTRIPSGKGAVEVALASLTPKAWRPLIEAERAKAEQTRLERTARHFRSGRTVLRPDRKPLMWAAIATAAVVLVGLPIGCVAAVRAVPALAGLLPASVAGWVADPTATPTVAPTVAATATATLTPTPTATATATVTPEPPLPASIHAVPAGEVAAIYPPVPAAGEVWLLDDRDAVAEPPLDTWNPAASTDPLAGGEQFHWTQNAAAVTWTLDAPLDEGLYQLYVLDTLGRSFGPQEFQVSLDGAPAAALRGSGQTFFDFGTRTDLTKSSIADEWLPIGAYAIARGQTLSVRAEWSPLTAGASFSVDRLLIVQLSAEGRGMLEALPQGRTLVSLLDDDRAEFFEVVAGQPAPASGGWSVVDDALGWNGDLRTRSEVWQVPVRVDWRPVGRLPAGRYELYVWVPEKHATVAADFALLANGQIVAREAPAQLNLADYHGEWATVGTWDLKAEAAVGVRMLVQPGGSGEIAADAVALVRVDQ